MGLRLYRGRGDRGLAAVRSRWAGYIVPHARHALPFLERAVTDFRPDVVLVDQHAVGGAVIAERHGLPWATFAPSTIELIRAYRHLPRVEAWIDDRLAEVWPDGDARFSPHLTIAFTTAELTGPIDYPVTYVGTALGDREPEPLVPLIDGRPRVLVTMGTLATDLSAGFYPRIAEALAGLDVQPIIVAPDGLVPGSYRTAPVLDLLAHVDVVVGHGGTNTVCEALAHGVPLVMAPLTADQPFNATRVADLGAGVRVNIDRSGPEELRSAVTKVLGDRSAARRLQQSLAAAGGARAAADHLERTFSS
jgi:MGT family glycosyltransferase